MMVGFFFYSQLAYETSKRVLYSLLLTAGNQSYTPTGSRFIRLAFGTLELDVKINVLLVPL